jgi:hypothetical protein
MKRRLLNLLTGLSLLLWLHSQIARLELTYGDSPSRLYRLGSARGSVRFEVNRYPAIPTYYRGLKGIHVFFVSPWDPNPPGVLGFGLLHGVPLDMYADRAITRRTAVAIPWWLITTTLAFLWVRLHLNALAQRRREKNNCCPSCGYDLRATPEKCPECGHVPAGASHRTDVRGSFRRE